MNMQISLFAYNLHICVAQHLSFSLMLDLRFHL